MYKLEFTLKQHTPLIHFQHDQEGATLRASEVKPKLDKFILEQLKYVDPELYQKYSSTIKKFFSVKDDEHKASAYKLQTSAILLKKVFCFSLPNSDAELIRKHPKASEIAGEDFDLSLETPFFANNSFIKFSGSNKFGNRQIRHDSEWEKLRLGVFLQDISLTVFSFYQDVFDLVKFCLPYVFALENFGLRQSKGFGSFTIEGQTENNFKKLLLIPGISTYKKEVQGDWKPKLKEVVNTWKLLKAGKTHDGYYKADIMKYFCMLNGERWEKRIIKKEISSKYPTVWTEIKFNPNSPEHKIAGCGKDADLPTDIPNSEHYSYMRGLLGLAEFFEFVMKERNDKTKVNVSEESGDIERFKSPVTFKVIDDSIYLICHSIPIELSKEGNKNRLYDFELDSIVNDTPYKKVLSSLQIPDHFSISNFLDSAWLGRNFECSANWGKPNVMTVAGHHEYKKLELHGNK